MTPLPSGKRIDRRSFSQKRRAAICLRQDGKCADCGEKLMPSKFEIDHRQALIHGGDNADDNLAAICFECHKAKTRRDVHGRDHADRIASGGRQRTGPPLPGTRASGLRKRMNGRVEKW